MASIPVFYRRLYWPTPDSLVGSSEWLPQIYDLVIVLSSDKNSLSLETVE